MNKQKTSLNTTLDSLAKNVIESVEEKQKLVVNSYNKKRINDTLAVTIEVNNFIASSTEIVI